MTEMVKRLKKISFSAPTLCGLPVGLFFDLAGVEGCEGSCCGVEAPPPSTPAPPVAPPTPAGPEPRLGTFRLEWSQIERFNLFSKFRFFQGPLKAKSVPTLLRLPVAVGLCGGGLRGGLAAVVRREGAFGGSGGGVGGDFDRDACSRCRLTLT